MFGSLKSSPNEVRNMDVDVKEFLNQRRFIVLFSGGRDSLATLLWVLDNIDHDDWKILYIEVSGNTHPLCTEYVKRVCEALGVKSKLLIDGREDADFFTCLRKWGVPLIGKYRWCLYQFKIKVIEKYKRYSLIYVSGVRRRDSWRRKGIEPIEFFRSSETVVVNPILNWSRRQVIEYIARHGVDVNPCYKIYGHSGNCMFCPYHTKEMIVLTLKDPEWGEKILSSLTFKGRFSKKIAEKWVKLSRKVELQPLTYWIRGG